MPDGVCGRTAEDGVVAVGGEQGEGRAVSYAGEQAYHGGGAVVCLGVREE